MRSRLIAAAAVAIGVSLAVLASCGAGGATSALSVAGHVAARGAQVRNLRAARPDGATSRDHRRPRPAAGAAAIGARDRPFGPGCAQLPSAGAGLTRALPSTSLPVATAIARTPLLSDLAGAIKLAGLTKTLNAAHGLTVFAPDNAAFQDLGAGNVQALLSTRSDLLRVLKFQIVAARVRPADLVRQRVLTTVGGTKLYPSRAGLSYYVNNAAVTCGNLHTANATVYIVNQVVIPAT